MGLPKYSLPEIERRWLVDPVAATSLEGLPCSRIEDRYLDGGRLRLRTVVDSEGQCVFKLCKKYGKTSGLSEPITNLYLTEPEYEALTLPGAVVRKCRYAVSGGSLDVYDAPNVGLQIFEKEFESEAVAAAYQPPDFAPTEVTNDARYRGDALARHEVDQPVAAESQAS